MAMLVGIETGIIVMLLENTLNRAKAGLETEFPRKNAASLFP